MQNTKIDYQKRNKAMYEDYMQNASFQQIADKYRLSIANAREIIKRESRFAEFKADNTDEYELYKAIHDLPISQSTASRVWGVLRRNGIDNLADLKKFPSDKLRRFRNIGGKSMEVMLDAGLICKEEGAVS